MNASEIFALSARVEGDTKPLERDIARTKRAAQDLDKFLGGIGKNIGSLSGIRNIDSQLKSASSSAGGLFKSFAGGAAVAGISLITDKLFEGTAAIIDFSSRMEQTKIGFETLMGGAENATKHLDELRKFAVETPFEFEGLAKMSQRLQGVGVESQKVIPLIRSIGNIAAATGEIGAERLEGINTAVSQMISKTKVSAEEMEQLAERGVPAWKILSEHIGKTQAETRKLSEQGKISSSVMVDALQKIGSTKFADAMEKQSRTFGGAMSSIKDIAMQTGQTLFEPIYEEISKFTVKFSQSLQSQEAAAKGEGGKWGFALGESIGDSIGSGITSSRALATALKYSLIYAQEGVTGVTKELTSDFAEGLVKGFQNAGKGMSIADLRKLDDTIGQVKDSVKAIPSIAEQLKAKEAERDTKALSNIFSDLASKVTYFGDESAVSATKQQLISAGFTNLNEGMARASVLMAERLDKLKVAKKAEDDYTDKISNLRDEMAKLRQTAQFEISFPKATELDKFEDWAKRNVTSFAELRGEIEATRRVLTMKLGVENISQYIKGMDDVIKANEVFRSSFDREVRAAMEQQTEPFKEKLTSFAESLLSAQNVTIRSIAQNAQKINLFPDDFASKVDGFIQTIKTLESSGLDSSGARKGLATYLSELGDITLTTGEKVRIFTDKSIAELTDKWLVLSDVMKKSQVKDSVKNLDGIIGGLGLRLKTTTGDIIGTQTPLEKLTAQLSDAGLTEAIAKRAASLNMTADALKQLLLTTLQHQGENSPEFLGGAGAGSFFDMMREKMEGFKSSLPSLNQTLTDSIGGALENISGSLSSALTNWGEGFGGFFRGIAASFADMAKQIIADMLKMLIYKGLLRIFGAATGAQGADAGLASAFGGGIAGGSHLFGGSGPGFARGGFTGNMPTDKIAGVVHGNEYVMPSNVVKKLGVGVLDSIANLQMPESKPSMAFAGAGGAMPSSTSSHVENHYHFGAPKIDIHAPTGNAPSIGLTVTQAMNEWMKKAQWEMRRNK
jgi:tape measure domain-containing protein